MTTPLDDRAEQHKLQFLGLAFAGADLVFEVNAHGIVGFALGAVEQLTQRREDAFLGSDWTEIFCPTDRALLAALLDGLKPGERQGPVAVTLRPRPGHALRRHASLSIFRLPQRGDAISCALSLGAPPPALDPPRNADGLLERETFTATAQSLMEQAAMAGLAVRLDLVELDGLAVAMEDMDPLSAAGVRAKVAAILRAESVGGLAASEIAVDRYALVRSASASAQKLTDRLSQVSGVDVVATLAQLPMEASTAQNLRAMRYALDRYIEDGPAGAAEGFMGAVKRTLRDTVRFQSILTQGAFTLGYQPVVNLQENSLHHFEALARFDPDASPADTIRLAEELGLIADFDLAVVRTVLRVLLKGSKGVRIAANVSAISLVRPQFAETLLKLTDHAPQLRPRLLLEITETQRLPDLQAANRVLADLRLAGHQVCIDDFGAGAASLDYLSHLDVDIVKIDGRYIQALGTRPRDTMILKHMAELCRDLGVVTIAEMVETSEQARTVQNLGIELAQGWCFGKPSPEPVWRPSASSPASRRVGSIEQWN
jgi:EAL domain-containing protein (putative c-di-GMP-specific phosphodiesterase class I)